MTISRSQTQGGKAGERRVRSAIKPYEKNDRHQRRATDALTTFISAHYISAHYASNAYINVPISAQPFY
jgi:hypothetical protein